MVSWQAGAVVVGVDGSEDMTAVDLAAEEAALRHRPLHVVHGFIWPYMNVPLGPSMFGPQDGGLRHEAERIVADAVTHARKAEPGIEVTGEVFTGSGTQALLARGEDATLIVVGDRGLGAFTGLLVGSVAIHVASHATCPVLVARRVAGEGLPVLLAADGSPASERAVRFAFEEAAMRQVALVALHVWSRPASSGKGDMLPLVYDAEVVQGEEAEVLAEALAGWREQFPDVVVRQRTVRGRVRASIIKACQEAQMVVLGARGLGGFKGLLLGSVSQAVLHHAACPTAIVSHRRHHE
jgi:nucleotide-binding universal stress UspA family protein